MNMMYEIYQAQCDFMAPIRAMAKLTSGALKYPGTGLFGNPISGHVGVANELLARSGLRHVRPAFGITSVQVGGEAVAVRERSITATPFATLLHFEKDIAVPQPRVLIVAAMSGHFSTLMRETVRTMLPDNDVYITDWHNARDVRLSDGRFDLDDYIDHVIHFLVVMGQGSHVVAVCQPCVPVLAAVAMMAESNNLAQPRSMTLMAGPIDTRVSPNQIDELATSKPIEWFEQNLISRVPARYAGAGRHVYPGFVQITAFLSMNMERHLKEHLELFEAIAQNDRSRAQRIGEFYDEYFSVLDMPAEVYLQTISAVFQEHTLARGTYQYRGRTVDPSAIQRTSLLTVEGEKDDICSLGQTRAAQELCTSLRPDQKQHYVQAGVGHYGVFNGRRWNNEIYPIVKSVILSTERKTSGAAPSGVHISNPAA